MTKTVKAYCSWCYKKGKHELCDTHWYSKNEYICENCKSFVVKCVACNEMAKGRFTDKQISELEKLAGDKGRKWISKLSDNWKDMFCAQHNGTISDFKLLTKRVNTLDKYPDLLKAKHINMKKTGTIALGVLTTAGVVAITAGGGAAAIAAAAGKLGLLGAASTGTAISTLSGAALTSASLAAVGGTVAAGTTIITAVGAGLGGYAGGVIANKYVGEDKYFGIYEKRRKSTSNTIFINGFLQQKKVDFSDWMIGHLPHFPDDTIYGITWGSKDLYELGKIFTSGVSVEVAKKFLFNLAKRGTRRFNPIAPVVTVLGLADNPWHVSMVRAAKTGAILADAISRSNEKSFRLVGHSLGCRVIYYALQALSTKSEKMIDDVILLGGAVGKDDKVGWKTATEAVKGKIYNCYSKNDMVLSKIYRIANANLSYPIGISPISGRIRGIRNLNCSTMITGNTAHMNWQNKYENVLIKIYGK